MALPIRKRVGNLVSNSNLTVLNTGSGYCRARKDAQRNEFEFDE